jgi:hypothetical protein
MQDKRDQFLDELLAAALEKQASAQPVEGLEDRILQRLRAREQKSGHLGWTAWRPWAVCGGIAAVIVLLLALMWPQRWHNAERRPSVIGSHVNEAAQTPLPSSKKQGVARTPASVAGMIGPKTSISKPHSRGDPIDVSAMRPPRFPTPTPPSEEEKLLLRYVRVTPPEVLRASLEKAQSLQDSLAIAPLEIKPLESETKP